MSAFDEQTLFDVLAPLGMTTTDKKRVEHDHEPGDVLTFADFNTSARHIATLIRIGDIAVHTPPQAGKEADHADVSAG